MARPRKPRICTCPYRAGYSAVFKPAGTQLKDMDIIHLKQDELEALHLCDGESKNQIEAGICMGVSRGTVQRLLANARCKVAQALVGQKALAISGAMSGKENVAVSSEWLERTAEGFAATHKAGIRYRIPFQIPSKCELSPDYITREKDVELT